MGWFTKKKNPELEEMIEAMDERSKRYVEMCDEFNKNFKPGDFIKYWRDDHEDWDSSFGFVVSPAGCMESPLKMSINEVWFQLLPFRLYGKSNPDSIPNIVHINDNFHAKKATQEDFIEYKKSRIQDSIDGAKDNIKRLKDYIRSKTAERNNINDFLKANWEISSNILKKHLKRD